MPALKTLVQLIHSLSKTERRNFSLFVGTDDNKKAYLKLYNLITKSKGDTERQCRKEFPGQDLNATVNYLYTVLMKSLIVLNQQAGIEEELTTGIQELKLLFRKGLIDEGFEKLDRLMKIASDFERFEYCIILGKMKLHYLNRYHFGDITEDDLLKQQSHLKKYIQFELNLADHASLYELLNYRFVMHGMARSAKDKEKLNDLVFAEMNLAGNPKYQSFNLKKNHLLFQSVYFMMTGDYKSSMSTFLELNNLFEANRHLWLDSPIYYIQHIKGILNNLHITGQYEYMQFFIAKLEELQKTAALSTLQQIVYIAKIQMLLGLKEYAASLTVMKSGFEIVSRIQNIRSGDKAEVYLYTALVNFYDRNFKEAARLLRQIIHLENLSNKQTSRTLKLINLIVHFELNDFNYLASGIRSLERELRQGKRNFYTEKVLLKLMKLYPSALSRTSRKKLFEKAREELTVLKADAYERQLFYVFDFEEWVLRRGD